MTAATPPANQNLLGKNGFQFFVNKLPNTNFFVQGCNIPGLSINPVMVGTPLVSIPYSGDNIEYEELTINFKVDEDLGAYIDVYVWLRGLGFSENTDEYAALLATAPFQTGFTDDRGVFSDATLLILDAKKRPNYKLTFIDAFPVSLSTLQLGVNVGDVQYLTADATFRYQTFDIERVKAGSSQHIQNPGG